MLADTRKGGLVLSPANARAWGQRGREVIAEVLRSLPQRVADHRVDLILVDGVRHVAVWGASWRGNPPLDGQEARFGEAAALRESSAADLLRAAPALRDLIDAPDLASTVTLPLRRDQQTMALLVVHPLDGKRPSPRALNDLRRYARLAAATLQAARQTAEEARELDGYRALSHLLDTGAPRDRKTLARALGKSLAAVIGARNCLILARANSTAPLSVIASRGYPGRKASGLVLWPQDPPWAEVLGESDRPFELDAALLDSGWQAVVGAGPILVAPVYWKGWLRSVIIFPSDLTHATGAHLLEPERLSSVAAHAGLLWQNAELIQRLRRDEEVLQGLTKRAVQVQEEERRRIASDIHDGVTQRIVSIWYRVMNLKKLLLKHPEEAEQELETIKAQLDLALQEARGAIYNLRPSTLDDLGLIPSLRSLVHDFEKESGVACLMQIRGERRLPSYFEVGIYRIVQEALRNIKKHAQAATARVSVHIGEEAVRLTIIDDGRGFSRKKRSGDNIVKSFGLESMEERAQMLGADLFVRSHPGEGTQIRVSFRVPPEMEREE
ncbi:MAG: GAF domain-containing sensor histidine kinase [Armatimonadetes bacterium]|nr:GAF domain-containing sensor histidine kinase [Armatimonadota bacterium]